MEEIFKDIPGYEGLYQVSNLGKCLSIKSNKILRLQNNGKGYRTVSIGFNYIFKKKYIHRLVAEVFIPNPENKLQVNHKDGNKLNNCVDNLEWVTSKENCIHSVKALGKQLGKRKKVELIDNLGNKIIFHSRKQAGMFLKVTGEAIQYSIKNSKKCKGFLCYNI